MTKIQNQQLPGLINGHQVSTVPHCFARARVFLRQPKDLYLGGRIHDLALVSAVLPSLKISQVKPGW